MKTEIGSWLNFLNMNVFHSLWVCQPAYSRLIKMFQRSEPLVFRIHQLTENLTLWDYFQRKRFYWCLPSKFRVLYFKWQVWHHSNPAWIICGTMDRLCSTRDKHSFRGDIKQNTLDFTVFSDVIIFAKFIESALTEI